MSAKLSSKIPVTIFSGFLGSGKTTVISHLVDDLIASGVKVAYIKNEIGDENVDGVGIADSGDLFPK